MSHNWLYGGNKKKAAAAVAVAEEEKHIKKIYRKI